MGKRSDSESYIRYLRNIGVQIENAKEHESIMNLCDNYYETFEYMKNNPSKYESYEDYTRRCFDENTI